MNDSESKEDFVHR